jgi:hypothetical protein
MNPIIAIPARLAATGFPTSPADINGAVDPARQRRAIAAKARRDRGAARDRGVVGAAASWTPGLPSGSGPVAWAVNRHPARASVVVNLQGDVPDPRQMRAVLAHRRPGGGHGDSGTPHADCATTPRVKAVLAQRRDARRPEPVFQPRQVPSGMGSTTIGLYAFGARLDRSSLPQGVWRREKLGACAGGRHAHDAALIDRVLYEINTPEASRATETAPAVKV